MTITQASNLYTSIGERVSGVVNASKSAVLMGVVCNTANEDRFIMLFNRVDLPSVGTRPLLSVPVYANNGYSELNQDVLRDGLVFDLGIVWGFSTSGIIFQPGAITDGIVTLRWV